MLNCNNLLRELALSIKLKEKYLRVSNTPLHFRLSAPAIRWGSTSPKLHSWFKSEASQTVNDTLKFLLAFC